MVQWKGFTAEEDLENTKKVIAEFEERMNAEIKWQEKLGIAEKRDFKRGKLPEKYIAKMLYR